MGSSDHSHTRTHSPDLDAAGHSPHSHSRTDDESDLEPMHGDRCCSMRFTTTGAPFYMKVALSTALITYNIIISANASFKHDDFPSTAAAEVVDPVIKMPLQEKQKQKRLFHTAVTSSDSVYNTWHSCAFLSFRKVSKQPSLLKKILQPPLSSVVHVFCFNNLCISFSRCFSCFATPLTASVSSSFSSSSRSLIPSIPRHTTTSCAA